TQNCVPRGSGYGNSSESTSSRSIILPIREHVAAQVTPRYCFSEYRSVFERNWNFLKLVIISPGFAWRQRNKDERFGRITRIPSFFIRCDGTAPLAGDHHSLGRRCGREFQIAAARLRRHPAVCQLERPR